MADNLNYVVMKYVGGDQYSTKKSNNELLGDVGTLLTLEMEDPTWFFSWYNDPDQIGTGGNLVGLTKKEGMIFISILYGEMDFHTVIDAQLLYNIVVKWLELYKQRPSFVTLFMQDDKIWLRAHTDRCPIADAIPPK